jgi:hypothetical protein
MHEIPEDKLAKLREMGFGELQIEELKSTGATKMTTDDGSMTAVVSEGGAIAVTSTRTTHAGGAMDMASMNEALSHMSGGLGNHVKSSMEQAEKMLGQDLDGDGVVGSVTQGQFTNAEAAPTVPNPVTPAAPVNVSPPTGPTNMTSPISSGTTKAGGGIGTLLSIVVPAIVFFAIAAYFLRDQL